MCICCVYIQFTAVFYDWLELEYDNDVVQLSLLVAITVTVLCS